MSLKKFKIFTHGCRTNIYESEWLRSIFVEEGFLECEREEDADILILNSCCVTHKAERDARKVVSRFLRRENALKILTGCYSKKIKENGWKGKVNFIHDYREIPSLLGIKRKNIKRFHLKHTRFFLKIQEGCNFKCSYCIIPFVRGKSISRNPDDIFMDFDNAIKSSVKEVVISGTQIGDYGKEFKKDLSWLLENLLEFKGDFRIRLSSIEPIYLNNRLINIMKSPRICKHFHIPLQSGSNRILRAMRRPYNTSFFKEKINLLRNEIPYFCLGTDVITGFPLESEDDFNQTVEFLREMEFSHIHVFTYSRRPFTELENIKELPNNVKKERTRKLMELARTLKINFLNSVKGRVLEVLPEETQDDFSKGTSDEYVKVYYRGKILNKFIYVKSGQIFKDGLKGEVLCP